MPSDAQLGPNMTSVTVVLNRDLKSWLRRTAAEYDLTMSAYIARILSGHRHQFAVRSYATTDPTTTTTTAPDSPEAEIISAVGVSPPCRCACQSGGFCGNCGHPGCGVRIR